MVGTRSGKVAIVFGDGTSFAASIRNPQEMADMLLMALTYDDKQGYPIAPEDIVDHRRAKPN